ncbi:hypothetical protein ACFSQJ_19250 [Croceitalea marina]|uniref:DUF1735 domain-containing protein n=1 Tax=Croceitalea marina TaxID=1775166 RepID=A0ABW5N1W4_9FLAO
MKKNNLYFLFGLLMAFTIVSCEDDEPFSAGEGDPLLKNVISLTATLSTDQLTVGEGNVIDFDVTLPNSFASDASVTVRVELDNGQTTTGTATVAAGATAGSGSLTMPPDDGVVGGTTVAGALNAAQLFAEAILLDELEPGNTYVLTSNVVDLNIYPDTLPVAGGINVIADWNGAPGVDIDMQMIDRAFTTIFEDAASGSRFESDLFQNVGREDGIYDVYLIAFTPVDPAGTPYAVLFTLPDGRLVDVTGTLAGDTPLGTRIPVATFEKTTNAETGVISYINVGAL